MLDHLGIQVADVPASTASYEKVLAPLGFGAFVRDLDGNNIDAVCHT